MGLVGGEGDVGTTTVGSYTQANGLLTITFNASATSEAIDALIQNLTYANLSDTPTASRTLIPSWSGHQLRAKPTTAVTAL